MIGLCHRCAALCYDVDGEDGDVARIANHEEVRL